MPRKSILRQVQSTDYRDAPLSQPKITHSAYRELKAKDDGSDGDNWNYKPCKAPVTSSPPTNQHPVFDRPDVLPVTQPTVSKHGREI